MADNLTVEQRKKNMQHIKHYGIKDIDIGKIIVCYRESQILY